MFFLRHTVDSLAYVFIIRQYRSNFNHFDVTGSHVTEFGETTHNNDQYTPLKRSFKVTSLGTTKGRPLCDFLCVNSNLPHLLHRFRDMAVLRFIGVTTITTGGDNVLVPHPNFLAVVFKKARNFTASSHQNAGVSIWVFKNFLGVIPPDPHSGRTGVGRKRTGVGTQTLVPLNFSVVVAPLLGFRPRQGVPPFNALVGVNP